MMIFYLQGDGVAYHDDAGSLGDEVTYHDEF